MQILRFKMAMGTVVLHKNILTDSTNKATQYSGTSLTENVTQILCVLKKNLFNLIDRLFNFRLHIDIYSY